MTQMNLSGKIQISEIFRLKSKEKRGIANGGSLFSPVKVQFLSQIDKRKFFNNIKNLKGSIFKEIHVDQCRVKTLEKDYRNLDKVGYDLRKAAPGTKCKIVINNDQKYKLMVQAPREKKFSEYKM